MVITALCLLGVCGRGDGGCVDGDEVGDRAHCEESSLEGGGCWRSSSDADAVSIKATALAHTGSMMIEFLNAPRLL